MIIRYFAHFGKMDFEGTTENGFPETILRQFEEAILFSVYISDFRILFPHGSL